MMIAADAATAFITSMIPIWATVRSWNTDLHIAAMNRLKIATVNPSGENMTTNPDVLRMLIDRIDHLCCMLVFFILYHFAAFIVMDINTVIGLIAAIFFIALTLWHGLNAGRLKRALLQYAKIETDRITEEYD